MNRYLYKYVEYNCFGASTPKVEYFAVNNILDIESEILKNRRLDPKENTLMITPDMNNKNKWHFYWVIKLPFNFGVSTSLRYGYIEKIDSDKERYYETKHIR